jgi:hypothetical protein
MPLQRSETIDEPASRAMVQGNLFDPVNTNRDEFYNLMIINEKEKQGFT